MKANDEQATSKQSASSSKSKVPLPVGHMTQATMRVLENIGFTSAQQSCVYSLSSMMRNYFERLCNAANASADHAGRESLILEDANIAFKTMGVNITELHDYIREVNCFTTDLNVPLFPVSKSTTARFVPNKKIATEEKSASTLLNATDQAENAIKKKSTDEEMQRCEDQTSDIKRSLISPAPVADQRPASSLNKEFHRSQKQFPSFFGAKANQLGFVVVVPPKPKIEHPVKSAHHGNVPKVQPPKVPITFQTPPHRPTPDRPVQDRLAAAIMKMTANKIPDRPNAITETKPEIKQPDATDEASRQSEKPSKKKKKKKDKGEERKQKKKDKEKKEKHKDKPKVEEKRKERPIKVEPAAPPKEVAKPPAPDLPKPPEQKPVRVERREPPPRMEPEAEKAGPSRPVVVEKEEPKVEVLKNVIQESDSKVVIRAVDIQPKSESLKLKSSSGKVQKQKSVETEKAIIPPAVEVATFIPDLLPMLAEDGGETTEPYIQEPSNIVHKKKKAKKEKKHKDHDKEKEKKEKKKRKRNRDEESSDTAGEKDAKRRKHSEAHIPSPEEPRVPKLTIKFGPKITTSATPIVSMEAVASVVDPMPASSSTAPTPSPSPLPSTSTALKGISIKCVAQDPTAHTPMSDAPSTSTHPHPSATSQKKTQNEEIVVSMHAANPRRRKTSSSASSRPPPQRIDSSPQFTTPIAPGPSSSAAAVRKASTAGSSSEAKPSTSAAGSFVGPTPVVKALKIPRKGLMDAGDRLLGLSQEFRMSQEETSQEEVSRKEKKKPGIKKQSALPQSEEELILGTKVEMSADAPESKIASVTPEEVKRSDSSLKIKSESQIREPKGPRTPPIISLTEDTQSVKAAPKKQPSLKKSRSRETDSLEFVQPGKKAKVIQNIDVEALPIPLQGSKSALIPTPTSIEPKATPAKHGRKQSKPRRIDSNEISDEHREEERPTQVVATPKVVAPTKTDIKAKTPARARKPSGSRMKKKESLTEAFGKEFHIGNNDSPHSDSTTPAFAPDESNDMPVEPMEEEDGDVWICPVCSVAYVDGTADMVGCDGCDSWFHWHCVGIQIAPPEDKQWYCHACNKKKKGAPAKKTGPVSKPKKKGH